MSQKIKVLVVDDSAVMRRAIIQILESTGQMEVVGYGRSGKDAIEKVKSLKPDIVTLDIEMPVMDGITALRHIMKHTPVPVVMVSSLTTDGTQSTIEALNAGAVDFIPKNFAAIMQQDHKFIQNFIDKLLLLARKKIKPQLTDRKIDNLTPASAPANNPAILPKFNKKIDLVLIGASTGGPKILHQIIPNISTDFKTPIVIVQHMPPYFTKSLADRLNLICHLPVKEAEDGDLLEQATIYIAQGGQQMLLESRRNRTFFHITDAGSEIIFKPSIDLTARSIANNFQGNVLAIMLTGMGKDGLHGFMQLKNKNAHIIAQSMETAIINGMPKAVADAGIADEILHTDQITARLSELCTMSAAARLGRPLKITHS
ncbi:MAG: chemotaxis response regulator protein-glutamate methylesterase [Calditrichaeota bacterium]|nr:MAG: chemotaxis response regulator protein-glutamate methylesterase [Calditrichota bacterium]